MTRWLLTLLRAMRGGRWRDLLDVAIAQGELAYAQLVVWLDPQGRLVNPITLQPASRRTPAQFAEPERLARANVRASLYGPLRPRCLVRALALHHILERHGHRGSVVRIGVRREGSALIAHAWVELDGRILGDRAENTATFRKLADVRRMAWVRG